MKEYNGFTGDERNKAGAIIRRAIKSGKVAPPTKCCLCSQEKGLLHYHLEDYSKPLQNLKPICVGCHMRLHIRFEYPNLWKKHLHDLQAGKNSPAYTSTLGFFHTMRKAGITKDIGEVSMVENPKEWYELLLLTPINLKP